MKPLVKVPLTNGAIAGILGAGLNILLFYINRHPFLIPIYFDYRILLLGIFLFFTLKEFRDLYQNNILYFWQGLIISFIFTSVFAVTASLILYTFASVVPEFVQQYITSTTEILKNWPKEEIDRVGKDVFQRNLDQLPATNAFDLTLLYFLQCYILGFFISIILSVLLRKQPKN
jgi:hypothetical protein